MTHGRFAAWTCCCLLAALALAAGTARADAIDPGQSEFGFSLKTRWGQTLEGRFPVYEGEVATLADGRHQVRLELSAADVEIVGHASYTRLTRGKGFFDAGHYPRVSFVSDPYPRALLLSGGELGGLLTIRGVQRREVFTVAAATCERPAKDCDVVARGTVMRSDYGVDRWAFALGREVRFTLRVRTGGDGA